MANSPSSKKRALQAERRAEINKARRSRMRTFIRKVEEAIAARRCRAAAEALRAAQPEIMRSVTQGRRAQEHREPQDFPPRRPGEGAGRLMPAAPVGAPDLRSETNRCGTPPCLAGAAAFGLGCAL